MVKFDTDQIEPFLESNSYLWKDDIDQHINQLMVEASVTYIQASNMIAIQEMEYACLHAFMDILYYKNIRPHLLTLPLPERYKIGALLNDFRDILDPLQRIPDFFSSGYPRELIHREWMFADGRILN